MIAKEIYRVTGRRENDLTVTNYFFLVTPVPSPNYEKFTADLAFDMHGERLLEIVTPYMVIESIKWKSI